MNIQKEINKIMKEHCLSPEAVADRLGVRYITIYRWARGIAEPRSRLVLKALQDLKEELKKRR